MCLSYKQVIQIVKTVTKYALKESHSVNNSNLLFAKKKKKRERCVQSPNF